MISKILTILTNLTTLTIATEFNSNPTIFKNQHILFIFIIKFN